MKVERDFRLLVTVPGEAPTREDFLNAVEARFQELLNMADLDEEFVTVAKREWPDE